MGILHKATSAILYANSFKGVFMRALCSDLKAALLSSTRHMRSTISCINHYTSTSIDLTMHQSPALSRLGLHQSYPSAS